MLKRLSSLVARRRPTASSSSSLISSSIQRTMTSLASSDISHPDVNPSDTITPKLLQDQDPYLLHVYAKPPIVFHRGQGPYLFDMTDRKYLDFTAGIAVCALGHADAQVAHVAAQQAQELVHISNLFHNPHALALSKKLIDSVNVHHATPFSSVFFTNSGTEANEAALKIARKYARDKTGKDGHKIGIVAFEHAFHGRSMGALSTTANPKYREPFQPLIPGVVHHPYNQVDGLSSLIHKDTCAVILEPIQGEGGVVAASVEFLTKVRQLCDEHDVLLIYDEIQCGLGRTGHVWAHQALPVDLVPDILTVAKPLANGFPIGACIVSEKAAACMHVGDHGTTFGGSPFATRVALHVLDRIQNPNFLTHVQDIGAKLKSRLTELGHRYPQLIKDVRGSGLLIGVEMHETAMVANTVKAARERGLLLVGAGRNSIRFVPPLTINEAQVEEAMEILTRTFSSMQQ